MTTSVVRESVPGDSKGLKAGALGLAAATVVGVASTAPAYSLAATLGLINGNVGVKAPAIMWLAFIPMACIASAFYYLNRADPDCGTNFTWVTRAMSPRTGWMGGWSSMVADLVIMPNLAGIAAIYTFQLFGWTHAGPTNWAVLVLGVVFIMAMTSICAVGIELSARTQITLLSVELAILVVFSVWALIKVYAGHIHGSVKPALSWLTPVHFGGVGALTQGLLLAVFIYWGWDTAVSVNEECEDANRTPGRAAVLSTIILVLIYLLIAVAAQSVKGPEFLANDANSGDVFAATGRIVFGSNAFGTTALKILIIAILSSAAASCQTTILPAARTALSMAVHHAIPPKFGEMSQRYLTPAWSTWLFGIVSSAWYVILILISRWTGGNVLSWSIAAVGIMIAYYYGQTGFACVIFYRRYLFKSVKNFVFVGLLPLIGGVTLAWLLFQSIWDMTNTNYTTEGTSWLGFSPVLWIGLGIFLLGIPLMFWWQRHDRTFFDRGTDPIDMHPPPDVTEPLPPLTGATRVEA